MTYPSTKDKLICAVLMGIGLLSCKDRSKNPMGKAQAQESPQSSEQEKNDKPASGCPEILAPRAEGIIRGPHLNEVSGLVVSSDLTGLFWVHNDSGDQSQVYALNGHGEHVGTVLLPGVARDWEDIALKRRANSPDQIYVADSGDNYANRSSGIRIHRFDEPMLDELTSAFPQPLAAAKPETMTLHYPSGPVDAEALLIDPLSDEIVLISKPRMELPGVYSVDSFSKDAVLEFQGKLVPERCGRLIHLVTAADISPDGRWILVRSYDEILLFRRDPDQSISEALQGRACFVPPAGEAQGEAIGFLPPSTRSPKGKPPSFMTVSEGLDQPLYHFDELPTRGGR